MVYMGDRLKYWEGKARFAPTAIEIEVFVDGTAEDSMERQQEFFQEVVQNWDSLREEIGRMLLDAWRQREPKMPIGSPWDEFRVSSMSIPKTSAENAEWEISFVTPSDPNDLWTVQMKSRKPQQLAVDG
jgi:hypothetical protein